jgi:hypothetical protein
VIRHFGNGPKPRAETLHSLIESAKLWDVEPRAYLREATLRALLNPGAATPARDLMSPRFRAKSAVDLLRAKKQE